MCHHGLQWWKVRSWRTSPRHIRCQRFWGRDEAWMTVWSIWLIAREITFPSDCHLIICSALFICDIWFYKYQILGPPSIQEAAPNISTKRQRFPGLLISSSSIFHLQIDVITSVCLLIRLSRSVLLKNVSALYPGLDWFKITAVRIFCWL